MPYEKVFNDFHFSLARHLFETKANIKANGYHLGLLRLKN